MAIPSLKTISRSKTNFQYEFGPAQTLLAAQTGIYVLGYPTTNILLATSQCNTQSGFQNPEPPALRRCEKIVSWQRVLGAIRRLTNGCPRAATRAAPTTRFFHTLSPKGPLSPFLRAARTIPQVRDSAGRERERGRSRSGRDAKQAAEKPFCSVTPRSPPFLLADDEESRKPLVFRARFLAPLGMTPFGGVFPRPGRPRLSGRQSQNRRAW
jgi:hypothetical protein